jgi:hypothetical protein
MLKTVGVNGRMIPTAAYIGVYLHLAAQISERCSWGHAAPLKSLAVIVALRGLGFSAKKRRVAASATASSLLHVNHQDIHLRC